MARINISPEVLQAFLGAIMERRREKRYDKRLEEERAYSKELIEKERLREKEEARQRAEATTGLWGQLMGGDVEQYIPYETPTFEGIYGATHYQSPFERMRTKAIGAPAEFPVTPYETPYMPEDISKIITGESYRKFLDVAPELIPGTLPRIESYLRGNLAEREMREKETEAERLERLKEEAYGGLPVQGFETEEAMREYMGRYPEVWQTQPYVAEPSPKAYETYEERYIDRNKWLALLKDEIYKNPALADDDESLAAALDYQAPNDLIDAAQREYKEETRPRGTGGGTSRVMVDTPYGSIPMTASEARAWAKEMGIFGAPEKTRKEQLDDLAYEYANMNWESLRKWGEKGQKIKRTEKERDKYGVETGKTVEIEEDNPYWDAYQRTLNEIQGGVFLDTERFGMEFTGETGIPDWVPDEEIETYRGLKAQGYTDDEIKDIVGI